MTLRVPPVRKREERAEEMSQMEEMEVEEESKRKEKLEGERQISHGDQSFKGQDIMNHFSRLLTFI